MPCLGLSQYFVHKTHEGPGFGRCSPTGGKHGPKINGRQAGSNKSPTSSDLTGRAKEIIQRYGATAETRGALSG